MFFGVSKSNQKDHKINTTKNEKIRNLHTSNISIYFKERNFAHAEDIRKFTLFYRREHITPNIHLK